jgi:hypothetical protein
MCKGSNIPSSVSVSVFLRIQTLNNGMCRVVNNTWLSRTGSWEARIYACRINSWFPSIWNSDATSTHFRAEFTILIKLLQNKVVMHIYSSAMYHFYQPLVAKLPIILPHAGAITVQSSWIYDHITVYPKCFTQQSNVSSRRTHASTKAKSCSFDFVQGFCRSFSHVTSSPHPPYLPDNQEFIVCM